MADLSEDIINSNLIHKVPQTFLISNKENGNLDLKDGKLCLIDIKKKVNFLSITQLDLTNNKLLTIPSYIFQFTNLIKLVLDKNIITIIPPNVGEFTFLKHFSINNNNIFYLPNEINNISNTLEQLDISLNKIRFLNLEIGELTKIKKLYSHSNRFIALPTSIYKMINLEELSLDWFKYTIPERPTLAKDPLIVK